MAALLRGLCNTPVPASLVRRTQKHPCICSASGIQRASRTVRVRLPDGTKTRWQMSSQEDLETLLHTYNAVGGVLQAATVPAVIARFEDLTRERLYTVVPSIKGFRLIESARYPRPVIEVPCLTKNTLKDLMKNLGLAELRPMSGLGEGIGAFVKKNADGHICIEDLRDNTEYLGIPAPARPKTMVMKKELADDERDDVAVKALEALAREEHAGATVTAIRRKVYQNPQRPDDDVEVGAACIVSLPGKKIAYIAEVVRVVNCSFLRLRASRKVDTIRRLLPSMPALQADFADCTHAEMLVFADCIDVDNQPTSLRRVTKELGVRLFLRLRGRNKDLPYQPFDLHWEIRY